MPTSQCSRGDRRAKTGPQVSRAGFHCALFSHSASTEMGSKGPMLALGWGCPVTTFRMAPGQFPAPPAGLFNLLPSPGQLGLLPCPPPSPAPAELLHPPWRGLPTPCYSQQHWHMAEACQKGNLLPGPAYVSVCTLEKVRSQETQLPQSSGQSLQ